jgi:DNA recombination protein RmuC
MEIALFIIIIILFAAIAWRLWNPRETAKEENPQSLLLLQNQIAELNRTLDAKLGESVKAISDSKDTAMRQGTDSNRLIKEITEELGKLKQGQEKVIMMGDNLKNLEDILKNPKQRGARGEIFLEMELQNILPPGMFENQHYFKDGTAVDAVIKTPTGLIPVDSKFSLENYDRINKSVDEAERTRHESAFFEDLKKRIDETGKYVKPEEGTLDFAFMFIPSEIIYYDLLNRKVGVRGDVNLIEYAFTKKRVIIVSPTTLLAYLQTVVYGLKALHIEESAKKIGEQVSALHKHLVSYQEYIQKVGKNLGLTVSAYTAAGGEFRKINKDIYRITEEEATLELPAVEKPEEGASE